MVGAEVWQVQGCGRGRGVAGAGVWQGQGCGRCRGVAGAGLCTVGDIAYNSVTSSNTMSTHSQEQYHAALHSPQLLQLELFHTS